MRIQELFEDGSAPSALERWFAGSKIVDASGKPMKLYHGTSKDADFKAFKMPKNGVWFTNDSKEASDYAETNDSQDLKYVDGKYVRVHVASRVIPCYVRATNPIILDDWPPALLTAENYRRAQGIYFDKLRAQGYDAIVFKNGMIVVVIGSPNQIKSAIGNLKFDASKKGLHEEMVTELSVPDTMKDAAKRLAASGYECLGGGSFGDVFYKSGADYVLKLFTNDDRAYIAFVKLAVANPNKYFPKFHGSLIRVNDRYSAIRMEYLEPLKGDFWYDIYQYIHYGRDETEEFMYNKELSAACDLIKNKLLDGFFLDIKGSNIMRRGNTPVITDPVCGEGRGETITEPRFGPRSPRISPKIKISPASPAAKKPQKPTPWDDDDALAKALFGD